MPDIDDNNADLSSVTRQVSITPSDTPEAIEEMGIGESMLGPTGLKEIAVNILILVFYLILIAAPFISYSFVSGGMRWISVVLMITIIGVYTIFVMNRGIQKMVWKREVMEKKYFSGELSRANDIVKRGSDGYTYSQYLMREMMTDAIIEKVRLGRGLTTREIERALDDPDQLRDIVDDEKIARFILENQKKAEGWSDKVSKKMNDRDKKESGHKFMLELNEIIQRVEAWE